MEARADTSRSWSPGKVSLSLWQLSLLTVVQHCVNVFYSTSVISSIETNVPRVQYLVAKQVTKAAAGLPVRDCDIKWFQHLPILCNTSAGVDTCLFNAVEPAHQIVCFPWVPSCTVPVRTFHSSCRHPIDCHQNFSLCAQSWQNEQLIQRTLFLLTHTASHIPLTSISELKSKLWHIKLLFLTYSIC